MLLETLTALLVLITAFYAWATFHILKANKKAVAEMQKQSEALTRPYVNIRTFTISGNPIIFLGISNIGKSSANNLRLQIDKAFYQFGEHQKEQNLANFSAFQQPIESFPPGAELTFYLAHGSVLFGENARPEITPLVFTVKASYSYPQKTVEEATTIDLRQYLKTVVGSDTVVDELKEIRKCLVDALRAFKRQIEHPN